MEKLYNKYRFKNFDSIAGEIPAFNKIKADIESGNIDHTYLFFGGHGVGKTSIARVLASHIPNCYIEEVSSAVDNGVEKSKELARNINQIPIGFSNKMILLDEIQRGSGAFFDALLKSTEECPPNVYWVLATTEIKKIPANIKSRFTKIEFTTPDIKSMRNHLNYICEQEGIITDRKVLTTICERNQCIPRDCISSLQLLVGVNDIDTQLKLIDVSETQETSVGYELAKLLSKGAPWKAVSTLLKDVKDNEVEGIRRTVLNYFNTVLLNTGDKNSALILDSFSKEMYDVPKTSLLLACYENI